MKISDLISMLKAFEKEEGDIEVMLETGMFEQEDIETVYCGKYGQGEYFLTITNRRLDNETTTKNKHLI